MMMMLMMKKVMLMLKMTLKVAMMGMWVMMVMMVMPADATRIRNECDGDCSQQDLTCTVDRDCGSPLAGVFLPSSPQDLRLAAVPSANGTELVLSVSWSLPVDASVRSVTGFCVDAVIRDRHERVSLRFPSPPAEQRDPQGRPWRFEYACFPVKPGDFVHATVSSQPHVESVSANFTVPVCTDPKLGKLPLCEEWTSRVSLAVWVSPGRLLVSYRSPGPRRDHVLRLCRLTAISCADAADVPIRTLSGSSNWSEFPVERALPCLCVEVYASDKSSQRVRQCPFENVTERWGALRVSRTPRGVALRADGLLRGCPYEVRATLLVRRAGQNDSAVDAATFDGRDGGSISHEFLMSPETGGQGDVCVRLQADKYYAPSEVVCVPRARWRLAPLLALGTVVLAGTLLAALGVALSHARERFFGGLKEGRMVLLLHAAADGADGPSSSSPALALALATYLSRRCGADVALDLWEKLEVARLGPAPWLAGRLELCRRSGGAVVVLASGAARRRWDELRGLARPPPAGDPPAPDAGAAELGDLFAPALRLLCEQDAAWRGANVLVVCVDGVGGVGAGAPPFLRPARLFRLPGDLRRLSAAVGIAESVRGGDGSRRRRETTEGAALSAEIAKARREWARRRHGGTATPAADAGVGSFPAKVAGFAGTALAETKLQTWPFSPDPSGHGETDSAYSSLEPAVLEVGGFRLTQAELLQLVQQRSEKERGPSPV